MTIWTPGALSIRERETPYLLQGKYRDNGNSGAVWVYTFLVVVIFQAFTRSDWIWQVMFFLPCREEENDDVDDDDFDEDDTRDGGPRGWYP